MARSTTSGAVLDQAVIDELKGLSRESDPGLFAVIVETFVTDGAERVKQIMAAHGSSDPERMSRAAHTLKGSARTVGAVRLGDTCERIEEWASGGEASDDEALQELIRRLRADFRRASEALGELGDPV